MSKVDIINRWFNEVWCQQKTSTNDELLDPDAKLYGISPDAPLSVGEFKQIKEHCISKYPDMRIEVTKAFESG